MSGEPHDDGFIRYCAWVSVHVTASGVVLMPEDASDEAADARYAKHGGWRMMDGHSNRIFGHPSGSPVWPTSIAEPDPAQSRAP
jgi:hypothetical protein